MKKRILFLFMAVFIATAQPVYCYADAASLTIAGSIGTEGLTIASMAGLMPYAVAVVGGVLVASGINVYLTNASQQAGKTKSQFISDSIKSYCSAAQRDTGEFVYNILNDIRVGNQGAIELGSRASTQIKQLINWLQSQDKIFDTSQTSSPSVSLGNNLSFPLLSNWTLTGAGTHLITTNNTVCWAQYYNGTYTYLYGISKSPFTYNWVETGNVSFDYNSVASPRNGYYYSSLQTRGHNDLKANGVSLPNTGMVITNFLSGLDGTFDVNQGMVSPTSDSYTSAGIPDVGALSPSAGNTTVLNPDILGDLVDAVQGIANANISIQEYLKAIGLAIDGLAGGIRARDIDTDAVIEVVIPAIDVFDPDIDQDIPNTSGTDPAIDPNSPADVDVEIEGMKFDLKTIFPFCIPFDVVDMIKLLNAQPIAPRYTVNWQIPIVNRTLTFEVDLSPFDQVASILRNLEVIIFCIGLAMVTRSMFIRG